MTKKCSTDGCGADARCAGKCQSHYNAEYHARHRDRLLESARQYRQENNERIRAYDRARYSTPEAKERKRLYDAEYRAKNRERYIEYERVRAFKKLAYRRREKERYARLAEKRRKKMIQATLAWVDLEEIARIYDNCPKGHHVDHIVPLQGRNVSGLHVPWNLQYLTSSENSIKSNKLLEDYRFVEAQQRRKA